MESQKEIVKTKYKFLEGGGEMGALTRAYDWSKTSIGTPDEWPQSLRNTVSMILASKFPMFLWWGDELIQFYNDAYRPSLGNEGKHPQALGQQGEDCWHEIWDIIHPRIQQVRTTGEATWNEDELIPIYRNGKLEDVYWTFGYSAIRNDSDAIEGVLVVCTETTAKIKAIKELETSNQQFKDLVMRAPVAIAVFRGEDFIAELANDAYLPIVGKTREQFVAKPLFETLPETRAVLEPIAKELVRTGIPFPASEFELVLNRNGGYETCYFNSIWEPLREADGKINGFMAVVHEITQHVIARKKTEENEARLRSIIAAAPAGIGLFVGRDLVVEMPNQTFIDIVGKGPDIEGKPLREVMPELLTEGQPFLKILDDVFTSGQMFQSFGSQVIIMREGVMTYNYYNITYTPLFDTNGEVYAILDIAIDVTEQIAAQKKAEESEERFRTMAEGSDILIAIADANSSATYFNNAWTALTGTKEAELLNRGWGDLIHPEDRDGFVNNYLEAVKKQAGFNGEFRILNRGGTYSWLFAKGLARFSPDGSFAGHISSSFDITERMQNEKDLKENEERYRTLISESSVATGLYTGRELRIQYANDILIGYWRKDASVIGKPLAEAVPELQGQSFLKKLDDVYTLGIPYSGIEERALLMVDGKLEEFYFNFTYKPLYNASGEIYGIHHMSVDVTRQVIAQKKLEQSEQRIRFIIESAPFPIGVYEGKEMRIVLANQAIINAFGKGNDVIGKLYSEVLPELDNQQIFDQLDAVFTTGIPYHARNQRVDIDTEGKLKPFYFNYSFTPVYDATGSIYGVMNTAADVTDIVQAKQKVEANEKSFRNTILKAPVAMCILKGPDHVVEIANDLMIAFWGKTAGDVMHKPIFEGLPEAKEQGFEQILSNVYTTGETFSAQNVPISLPRGEKLETLFINFVYEANVEPDGHISGVLAVAIDVTDQVLARQKIEEIVAERTEELAEANKNLQKSNAELEQFAYIASHDLQEPLRKITIFTQMLEHNLGKVDEKSKGYFHKITNASSRMTSLVRDVLAYSQLSKDDNAFVPIDLNDVVDYIKTDFELLIEQKNAVIYYNQLPVIEGIQLQISQLFGNLVSNSLKFSREGIPPLITITTHVLSREEILAYPSLDVKVVYYNIEFRDNGIGFSPEYAEQIFNIFQRLHGKTEFAGTGIGLAICKKIALNHHGDIVALSSSEAGAVFNIILPEKQVNEVAINRA